MVALAQAVAVRVALAQAVAVRVAAAQAVAVRVAAAQAVAVRVAAAQAVAVRVAAEVRGQAKAVMAAHLKARVLVIRLQAGQRDLANVNV